MCLYRIGDELLMTFAFIVFQKNLSDGLQELVAATGNINCRARRVLLKSFVQEVRGLVPASKNLSSIRIQKCTHLERVRQVD